jgi:hypothetical protein
MDGTMTALLVAVVGVVGTTVSALLAQSRGERSRREERERGERLLSADREARERRRVMDLRRSQYAALNTAARQYLTALADYAHALRIGADPDRLARELDTARGAHRDRYAEAQMTLPDPVLEAVRTTNRSLNATYGMLMRLTNGTARPGETPDEVLLRIRDLWVRLAGLRRQLRDDLAVRSSPPAGGE